MGGLTGAATDRVCALRSATPADAAIAAMAFRDVRRFMVVSISRFPGLRGWALTFDRAIIGAS